ncbi:MAG: SseB family protein [Paracoccaceae bacterium]
MAEMTSLDAAYALMEAAAADDAARLRFYERLAESELYVLLSAEAQGDRIEPDLFEVEGVSYVLVFDRETRLTKFVGKAAPYAALSGRAIAAMLAQQQLGLGLNLEVAPSSFLMPPDAVDWLSRTLGNAPDQIETRIEAFRPPGGLPETLISALDKKLATATGMAHCAYLAGVTYEDGKTGYMLGFVDALVGAQDALVQAANEALMFSGIEATSIDVGFFAAADLVPAHLARSGLRFDLPKALVTTPQKPTAPGSDPTKPPILR